MSGKLISRTGSDGDTSHHAVLGSPCWVSLAARDLSAAEAFYRAVLGWTFRAATLGERFRVALAHGRAVAGIGAVAPALQVPVAWTPYFAVADADETVGRVQERGGTVGVGPIGFPTGRAALVSDRAGAVFGIWAGRLIRDFGAWRRSAPLWLRLVTRDAFDAAIFYGEVLEWTSPGRCDVRYEDGAVVLVCAGEPVASLCGGGPESAPDPELRPRWQVRFIVPDAAACARAAEEYGGTITGEDTDAGGECVTLRDPEGAELAVFAPREA
ncbi:VOC family protein [Streptomyces antnestii]|uniref:VOC family protein n=1 Tax=Streptomyces antnestii TaxID=2494256 RepID=A0A3S2YUU6_9ACTN|nr:VOC family protein [Streptomyces sp. San01]RVU19904.1 VOC family protein [Streptomyces sp. San01]